MLNMKRMVAIFCLMVLSVPSMPVRSAPAHHLVISEIQITGESGFSTDEFVELYNPTNSAIPLTGWKLTKKTASGSEYDLLMAFPDRSIPKGGFFLVSHPTGYSGSMLPDAVYSTENSIASNNTVILYDAAGNILDTVGMGTTTIFETAAAPNPGANKSIERKAVSTSDSAALIEGGADYFRGNGEDADSNANDFVLRATVEPQNSSSEPEFISTAPTVQTVPATSPSQITPPIPTPASTTPTASSLPPDLTTGIILNEVYPSPKTSAFTEEYIELLNTTTRSVRLDGWKLTDTKKKYSIPIGTSLGAGDTVAFTYTQTKITLNNGGDTVYLQDPNGKVIQGMKYDQAPTDKAFGFFDKVGWRWTDPTPGDENVLVEIEEVNASAIAQEKKPTDESETVQRLTIRDARKAVKGQLVEIEAMVSVGPNVLGSKMMYVQDATGGIKVTSTEEIPDVSTGDVVSFSAKIGSEQSRPKLNLQDASTLHILRHEESTIPEVAAQDLESYPSQLVRVTGTFQSVSRSVITLEDVSGDTCSVYLKKSAGIDKPDWIAGDQVSIVGIVDEYADSVRVLPRGPEDMVKPEVLAETVVQEKTNPKSEVVEITKDSNISKQTLYILGALLIVGGIAGWYVVRKKIKD